MLRSVKIFLDFAEWRDDVCGKRLRNIRAHLSPLGEIDWNGVSYLVEWNDGEVRSIVHCQSSKQAVLPEGHGLNVNFDWNFFWHDLQAEAVLPPMKAIKLFTFFKERRNSEPFGYPFVANTKADTPVTRKIAELNDGYIANLQSNQAPAQNDEVTQAISQANKNLVTASANNAREKRLKQLEDQRAARKLTVAKAAQTPPKTGGKESPKSTTASGAGAGGGASSAGG